MLINWFEIVLEAREYLLEFLKIIGNRVVRNLFIYFLKMGFFKCDYVESVEEQRK